MKIIKEGSMPNTTKRFKCSICGCIFEANKGEYRASSWWEVNLSISPLPAYKCACPTCRHIVYAD